MEAMCSICGEPVEVTLDELLEDDEFYCNDCACAILMLFENFGLRKN